MGRLADLASSLLDALYPYNRTAQVGLLYRALGRCVLCKDTGATDLLCHACEEDLPWREPQRVPRLLNGLDAFASFNYCFPINSLIYNIKFRGGVGLAQLLGRLMAKHCPMPETDGFVVCPVPVSYRRHVERSFNQTWVLGQAIATQLELPIEANGLLRARHTPPQRGNRRALRLHNVKGAFVGTEAVRGQRVLVIDDVLTTGATAFAASSALKRAGAREVLVWACAAVN